MSGKVRRGWSELEGDWVAVAPLMTSLAWRSCPFDKLWTHRVPAKAGVYVLTGTPPVDGPFSKAWCPVYVGHTLDLRARVGQHLRGASGVRRVRSLFRQLRFYYAETETSDKRRLRGLEQLLIEAFGPIANDRRAIAMRIGDAVSLASLNPHSEKQK